MVGLGRVLSHINYDLKPDPIQPDPIHPKLKGGEVFESKVFHPIIFVRVKVLEFSWETFIFCYPNGTFKQFIFDIYFQRCSR